MASPGTPGKAVEMDQQMSRRRFLQAGAAVGAAMAVPAGVGSVFGAATTRLVRHPGSLPFPHLPPGTASLPQIEHIIVVMMENHSYDSYLGMLGRGDGFTLGSGRHPTNTNPDASGNLVHSFAMPNACQTNHGPGQNWNASHRSLNGGRNDGFVVASGPVAMGYWTAETIPFYYSLAKTFPLSDRWFSSCLAQTYPNRRFLMAGTAYGNISTDAKHILAPSPANGTIFDLLNAHGISWRDYYTDLPSVGLFKSVLTNNGDKLSPIAKYYTDAAAGSLPSVSLVEPNFGQQSEEDPQDIQNGEAFVSRVVQAAMHGPGWDKTLLIWNYDEGGGYYDHVPPPRAIKPDDIPPEIQVPPDQPGGYDRYGFRVPAAIVSPYARRNYVSHVVHDHTSILKLIETKWNLPALTFRDANADNLLDSLDLKGKPAFREPPTLAAPGLTTNPSACLPGDAGVIPPPGAVTSHGKATVPSSSPASS
jgi:phospholipase C